MKKLIALVGVLLAGLFLWACAAGKQFAKDQIQDPGQLLFNGHVRPEIDCHRCHNGDGRGARGPDLSEAVPEMDDATILKYMVEGAMFMPAYKDITSEAERQQILAWLRASFGGPNAEAPIDGDALAE